MLGSALLEPLTRQHQGLVGQHRPQGEGQHDEADDGDAQDDREHQEHEKERFPVVRFYSESRVHALGIIVRARVKHNRASLISNPKASPVRSRWRIMRLR